MDITGIELQSRLLKLESLFILDVREKIEFHTYNIGGTNLPLGMIKNVDDVDFNKHAEIIVVCQRGIRSKTACKILKAMGYLNARNLSGGLIALKKLDNH
ncbi:MAG TPA: rhodanese-like domain-containing protein [Sphingobacteriaceae bacterium]|nr:rhodanese-like domain-containing protein [Sphingobacteriaceae bacterium]